MKTRLFLLAACAVSALSLGACSSEPAVTSTTTTHTETSAVTQAPAPPTTTTTTTTLPPAR